MKNSTNNTNNKSSKYKRNSKNNKHSKSKENNKNNKRNKNNCNGKGGTKPERNCLCVPWEEALRPPPHAPLQLFLFCCFVLSCLAFLVSLFSLRWCKGHDVNELVYKLTFHNASSINQNGRSPCKMEGWNSEVQQISRANFCNYHATWKGLSSKCRRCHAKWEVLSPQCRLTLQNADNIANTPQTFIVRFSVSTWIVSPVFFLALQNLTEFLTSWLCLCSPFQCNQRHKRKEITNTAYTQAKTTKSTVIVCSFNSNNNNKKLPLQVQL